MRLELSLCHVLLVIEIDSQLFAAVGCIDNRTELAATTQKTLTFFITTPHQFVVAVFFKFSYSSKISLRCRLPGSQILLSSGSPVRERDTREFTAY